MPKGKYQRDSTGATLGMFRRTMESAHPLPKGYWITGTINPNKKRAGKLPKTWEQANDARWVNWKICKVGTQTTAASATTYAECLENLIDGRPRSRPTVGGISAAAADLRARAKKLREQAETLEVAADLIA